MNTNYFSCVPNQAEIRRMIMGGYRFKVDGKIMSKKKLDEFIANEGENTE